MNDGNGCDGKSKVEKEERKKLDSCVGLFVRKYVA